MGNVATTIYSALRDARKSLGVTQTELAELLGIGQGVVSARETGRQEGIPHDQIEAIVEATGQSMVVSPAGWSLLEDREVSSFPCYGKVPCGHPILIEDPPESQVHLADLTAGTWRDGRHFLLIADGDSMKGAGILDGDWLIVERREARLHDVVVATLNGASTVKRLEVDPETDEWVLTPANPIYDARQVTEYDECHVQGVVIGRMRYTPLR